LHCVDSRLEEDGKWYSRLHVGPFRSGSRLQIGTGLRRSLLNDLSQTSIIAVELEGALHEFSRLPGMHEPVLDLLFKFRKVALHAPFLKIGEVRVVPFLYFGPGVLYAEDISWPNGIHCRNPGISLATLATGAILRGHFLIQKTYRTDFVPKVGQPLCLKKFWKKKIVGFSYKKSNSYPWLRLGFPVRLVERVGFRIESIGPLKNQNEILIFEILTNGRISPRQALYKASILLVQKYIAIANLRLPKSRKISYSTNLNKSFFVNKMFIIDRTFSEQTFYNFFDSGFSCFREPLGLDLGNLDLTKTRYRELRERGFQTLGQLLERLAFESCIFSPLLKKQRLQALFRLGFFPSLIYEKFHVFCENSRSSKNVYCKSRTYSWVGSNSS
jgi:DNA-directed RNA polymerase alpha subunit